MRKEDGRQKRNKTREGGMNKRETETKRNKVKGRMG
jgi:hypothetical protein